MLTALYDACALYSAPLRDLLMWLALTGLVRARWTETIHEEWITNVLENRSDLRREQLERTRNLMNRAIPDCLVVGYEDLIPILILPDPDDRHVLAAAIRGGAEAIVTFNVTDFPPAILQPLGIEVRHPDEFVCHLFSLEPEMVIEAVRRQRANLHNPARTAAELLDTLEAQGLVQTVAHLRGVSHLL
jgi:hypothetical protein